MSFSSEVKKELCSVNAVDTEQKKAELYGLLIFSKVFKKYTGISPGKYIV